MKEAAKFYLEHIILRAVINNYCCKLWNVTVEFYQRLLFCSTTNHNATVYIIYN